MNGTPRALSTSAMGKLISPCRLMSRTAPSSGPARASSRPRCSQPAGPTTWQPLSSSRILVTSASNRLSSTTRTFRPSSSRGASIAPLPSRLGSDRRNFVRGGPACSLERRGPNRYDKAMTDLLDQGAAAIASAIRAGKKSARDVAEAAIARVEAKNKAITAIVDFDPAEARAAADAVDSRRKQGFDGPILGVPYTVKDTTWVQGRRVTNGSLLWKDFKPPRDAVSVERLKAAGGVFLGMTNTPEMAAKGHTENKVYGPSRHPMNPALTPGGSSGGAAAALAAGFTPIA